MSTTIQIRIDETLKKKAQKVADAIGMDLSSVIKTTLTQMVRVKGLPFTPRTENGFTPEYEERMVRETEEAIRSGKRYTDVRKMLADTLSEKE